MRGKNKNKSSIQNELENGKNFLGFLSDTRKTILI